jgi:hypothetical protein
MKILSLRKTKHLPLKTRNPVFGSTLKAQIVSCSPLAEQTASLLCLTTQPPFENEMCVMTNRPAVRVKIENLEEEQLTLPAIQ